MGEGRGRSLTLLLCSLPTIHDRRSNFNRLSCSQLQFVIEVSSFTALSTKFDIKVNERHVILINLLFQIGVEGV